MKKLILTTLLLTLAACDRESKYPTQAPVSPYNNTPPVVIIHRDEPDAAQQAPAGHQQGPSDIGSRETPVNGPNQPQTGDAGIPAQCNVVTLAALGTVLRAAQGTCGMIVPQPSWARRARANVRFVKSNGKTYEVLIYAKAAAQSFEAWMANSEVGDAYVSQRRTATGNGLTGYLYATNDYAAQLRPHVTIPSQLFVFYVHSDATGTNTEQELSNFVQELEIR